MSGSGWRATCMTMQATGFWPRYCGSMSLPSTASNRFPSGMSSMKCVELLTECADGLHEVAFGLRPQILTDLGLAPAVRSLATRLQGATGICIRVLDGGLSQRPGEQVELAAFRIAQEALSNAVKYAQPTLVKVSIRQIDDMFVMSVADNGIGFEPELIDSSSRPASRPARDAGAG